LRRLTKRNRFLAVGVGLVVLGCSSLVLGHKIIDRCGGWSGCDANGLPLGGVTVRDLESHPEATLYYPGATVIAHGGTDEQHYLAGRPGSAYATSILATPGSSARIYTWYETWLAAHGWKHSEVIQSTAELYVRGWTRGSREVVNVSILDPQRWRSVYGNTTSPGETLIRTVYGIFPAGG
jgi:hypothetical protein